MIKVDENDPVGELQPSFPYRDVSIKRNVEVKDYYDLESEIGRGKFGTVYRCKEKSTGLQLAAKFVGIAQRQDRRNVEREVEIMRALQHPRLIQLYDAFESNSVMCVIQELIEGGELFERVIDDDFVLTEKACSVFMRQICEGVEFIHSQNILHLDLKPENILCLTRTGNRIKIIDFGLARKYEPDKKLQVLFGTPEFVAPEIVNFDQIGFGTDMWSVGVICYVLLSGLSPFMGETDVETMANVTIAQYDFDDEAFEDISADAKNFITKLLTKNKEQRLTASECLTHVWLRRKPPPPGLPTQQTKIQINDKVENKINQEKDKEILGTTKENLREFVDRTAEQGSPSKVILLPINEPLNEINAINTKSPQIVNEVNKTLVKNDVKTISEDVPTKIEIDAKTTISTAKQDGKDKIDNKNKLDIISNNSGNDVPGKRLKLDIDKAAIKSEVSKEMSPTKISPINMHIPSAVQSLPTAINTSTSPNSQAPNLPSSTKWPPVMHNLPSPIKTTPTNQVSSSASHTPKPAHNTNNLVSITPSGSSKNLNNANINVNSSKSTTKSQPSSPIGTIPKTPSGSKLKFNPTEDNKKLPTTNVSKERSLEISQPNKISFEMISTDKSKMAVMNNNLPSQITPIKTESNSLNVNSLDQSDKRPTATHPSENVNKMLLERKSSEAIVKPPKIINATGTNKPKLQSQSSVPDDLSKFTLNKNVLASNSTSKHKDVKDLVNKTSQAIETKSKTTNIENNESTTVSKLNKNLNKHVVPPKIKGIVLGQTDKPDNKLVPENKGPKVITHKIIVEDRSDPVLPTSSTEKKENKKNDSRTQKPITKAQTSSKLELKENNNIPKGISCGNRFLDNDQFDRRGSDISCFLPKFWDDDTGSLEHNYLADEIKKLSSRLFHIGDKADGEQLTNKISTKPIPIGSFKNDPVGKLLANHGVSRRPKYRMSNMNRDVPIGSPPPPSNLFFHLANSKSDNWFDNQIHSAPQSPSGSPEREPMGLTKEVILRLFDKTPSDLLPKKEDNRSTINSIDSLASYFNANNENKKNVPPVGTSK